MPSWASFLASQIKSLKELNQSFNNKHSWWCQCSFNVKASCLLARCRPCPLPYPRMSWIWAHLIFNHLSPVTGSCLWSYCSQMSFHLQATIDIITQSFLLFITYVLCQLFHWSLKVLDLCSDLIFLPSSPTGQWLVTVVHRKQKPP